MQSSFVNNVGAFMNDAWRGGFEFDAIEEREREKNRENEHGNNEQYH